MPKCPMAESFAGYRIWQIHVQRADGGISSHTDIERTGVVPLSKGQIAAVTRTLRFFVLRELVAGRGTALGSVLD